MGTILTGLCICALLSLFYSFKSLSVTCLEGHFILFNCDTLISIWADIIDVESAVKDGFAVFKLGLEGLKLTSLLLDCLVERDNLGFNILFN